MTLVVFEGKIHIKAQDVVVQGLKIGKNEPVFDCELEGKNRISVDDIPWFG